MFFKIHLELNKKIKTALEHTGVLVLYHEGYLSCLFLENCFSPKIPVYKEGFL